MGYVALDDLASDVSGDFHRFGDGSALRHEPRQITACGYIPPFPQGLYGEGKHVLTGRWFIVPCHRLRFYRRQGSEASRVQGDAQGAASRSSGFDVVFGIP